MRYPNIITVKEVVQSANEADALIKGRWLPARPVGLQSFAHRCTAAWLVFTGKADALKWPGQ